MYCHVDAFLNLKAQAPDFVHAMLQFTNEAHMKIISHRKQLLVHDPGSSAQAPSVNRA